MLGISLSLDAQSYLVNAREISTGEGLSQKEVHAIVQDTSGFVWLGTSYGINRFDGYEFKWFTKKRYQFSTNEITEILPAEGGRFWLVHAEWREAKMVYSSIDLFNPFTLEVRRGEELFGEDPSFDLADVQRLKSRPAGPLLINLNDGQVFRYDLEKGLSKLPFPGEFALQACFGEKDIWGMAGSQLIQIELNGNIRHSYPLPGGAEVFQIVKDHLGRHWALLADQRKRSSYDPCYIQVLQEGRMLPLDLGGKYGWGDAYLVPLPEKEKVLVFLGGEVLEFDENLQVRYHHPELPSDYGVWHRSSFYVDRENLIWHGHREGLTLISWQTSPFTPYLKGAFGSKAYFPTRGLAVKEGKLLASSVVQAAVVDLRAGELAPFGSWAKPRNHAGWPLMVNARGEIWGWARNYLCRLDEKGNLLDSFHLPEKNGGVRGRVWSLMQDRDETWWLGPNDGLVYFHEQKQDRPAIFQQYNGFEGLRGANKWHLTGTDKGIWISSSTGLYFLDRQKGITARFASDETGPRYLPADQFIFAYPDKDGLLWLATEASGLLRVKEQDLLETPEEGAPPVQHFTRLEGLPSNELYAILEDEQEHLWISTANGLLKFNKETFELNSYFEEHGLTSNEFNRISSFKDTDGRMFLGGLDGVTAFYPDDFYSLPSYDARLNVSEAGLYSKQADSLLDITTEVWAGEEILFRPGDKYLSLEFSLQDYFYPDQLNYQYKIEGLNDDWTPMSGNRLQLSSLPYGKYQLEIRAQGPDRRPSLRQLSIPLFFLKPFYLQNMFIASFLFVLGVGIWQLSYWRIRALRKKQRELEEMVQLRTEKIRQDKIFIEEQAAELRELDEQKTRFFANVSHELRTPLTLILGPLGRLINQGKLPESDQRLIQLMWRNGQLLLKRINELLDLSSLDAGRMSVDKQPVRLHSFVNGLLENFQSGADLRRIELLLENKTDHDTFLMLDADKVEKIVSNYLSNALKFTPDEGQISVRVEQSEGHLLISIADTGPGLPEGELDKVFERFYQSEEGKKASGTGIGLSFCRELATLMEGKVWARGKEEGPGAVFYLRLAWEEATEAAVPVQKAAPKADPACGPEEAKQEGAILIVEDNPELRGYLKLQLDCFEIQTAEHGRQALDRIQEMRQTDRLPDLIITDIMMPVMDGFELLKVLKSRDDLCHIPVIMLTARQSMETKLDALRIGVDDYMTKPFREEELKARVFNLIKNVRGRDSHPTGEASPSAAGPSAADLKWLAAVEKLILDSIGNPQFNISYLADEMAMSTRRFQQKIKQITGLTPKAYQREIQLEQARRMLESGDYQTVSEISYRIGFKDAHYFSSLYEKRFGRKPSEYL